MFALIKNNIVIKYPYTIWDLKNNNPNTSIPINPKDEDLKIFDVYRVFFSPVPEYDKYSKVLVEVDPVYDSENSRWSQSWLVRDKTSEEKEKDFSTLKNILVNKTQEKLDTFAKTRGYDDIRSASDYSNQDAVPKFKIEGLYAINQRAIVWKKLYEIIEEISLGKRSILSFEEIEAELPSLEWPES